MRSLLRSFTKLLTVVVLIVITITCNGCGNFFTPQIDYATVGSLITYNSTTIMGAASAGPQVFARTLLGFGYHGPNGGVIPDHDFGTLAIVNQNPLTVDYHIRDEAIYSDNQPITCDDLVLAWIAQSGKYPAFHAATRAGYKDIDHIDCIPGEKTARVSFFPDRNIIDYAELFVATSLMPSHIIAQHLGIDLTSVLQTDHDEDDPLINKIAHEWNTRWDLKPESNLADFPSSGPYQIHRINNDGSVLLSSNQHWWGAKPTIQKILVWPNSTNIADRINTKKIYVVDIDTGSTGPLSIPSTSLRSDIASGGIEQLIFNSQGLLADATLRRAIALCIPRDTIAEHVGIPIANSRLDTADDDALHDPENIPDSEPFAHADLDTARDLLDGRTLEVKIGYYGPNKRLDDVVELISHSCNQIGIHFITRSDFSIGPQSLLHGDLDILIASTGGAPGSGSTGSSTIDAYELHCDNGNNLSRYCNERIDDIIDALAVTASPAEQARLLTEASSILWEDIPTLPLYRQYRTVIHSPKIRGIIPNPTQWGIGWNMDRWVIQQ